MALTIKQMAERSHALAKEKGFWDGALGDGRSFIPEKLMLIVSELSEALESYRKGEDLSFYVCKSPLHIEEQHGPAPCSKPEGVASELADAVIRCGDLAARLGIDLERAIEEKHAYNLTRPHKHGKVC
jgi:NTP pyrophosphatase (non-canonical NTP hydrolase)